MAWSSSSRAGIVVHRPVRVHPRPPPAGALTVAPPPTAGPNASGLAGWLQYLVPVAGSGGSVAFLFAVPGPRPGWLVALVVGAAVASVAAGLALRLAERRTTRRARRRERARYFGHLSQTALQADHLAAAQLAVAEHRHPDLPLLWATVERTDRLWERRPTDADFLTVRIGRGPVPLTAPARLDRPADPLVDHDPELQAAAEQLVRRATWLPDAPVVVPLRRLDVIALTGPPARTRALARAVICELAAFHAPDDLRLLAAYPPAAHPAWQWTEWLPHRTGGGSGGASPHLVGIVDATEPPDVDPSSGPDDGSRPGRARRAITADELLGRSAAAGGTVIWLARSVSGEPSELSVRVRLDDRGWATVQETTPGGRPVGGIRTDAADLAFCETLARHLAPRRLERPATTPAPAGPVRLLDLLDPRAGPAGPGGGLPPRPRSRLLQVPVGVGADGDPLVLDLREAAEGGIGPHGLVVGATGSGKSELLRTIVAGLAATHPPDQLAFVLVDFKGGAAFADLAPLRQVAGRITNLQSDGSMVDRAMAALQGELTRRQRLLHGNGNQPDLRAYAARRALDPRLEPLPHLLIVVDEFGELLAARPEFLDLFAAIGRVGRSLGMHLLLASQRLDEGRLRGLDSHLRFRICLRTFSAADSTAVLGVPDAYHLPPAPGTALLKVDAAPPAAFTAALVSTDLATLVGGLAGAGRPVHQVWLPPLAAHIALDPLLTSVARGWLRVPVGVVDRPLEQEQGPLVLDLSGGAGHLAVVGAPRTGKSTLLCTLVAAMAATTRRTRSRSTAWTSAAGSSIGWATCRTSGPYAVPARPNGSAAWCASCGLWSSCASGGSVTSGSTRWPPGTLSAGPVSTSAATGRSSCWSTTGARSCASSPSWRPRSPSSPGWACATACTSSWPPTGGPNCAPAFARTWAAGWSCGSTTRWSRRSAARGPPPCPSSPGEASPRPASSSRRPSPARRAPSSTAPSPARPGRPHHRCGCCRPWWRRRPSSRPARNRPRPGACRSRWRSTGWRRCGST
jgi:DNA segregation ATPase FtsK/SpoIIIE, S-DNA-T family